MAMATLMFFDDEEVSSMEPKTTRVPTKKQLQNYVHFFFRRILHLRLEQGLPLANATEMAEKQ